MFDSQHHFLKLCLVLEKRFQESLEVIFRVLMFKEQDGYLTVLDVKIHLQLLQK